MLRREYYQYELIDLVGKEKASEIVKECKRIANGDVIIFERELKKQVEKSSKKENQNGRR